MKTAKTLLLAAALLLATAATHRLPKCTDSPYCGFNRPEDISLLPGSDWSVVSQSQPEAPFVLLNLKTGTRTPVKNEAASLPSLGDPLCKRRDGPIEARGNSVSKGQGGVTVAVIDARTPAQINLFKAAPQAAPKAVPQLAWAGCVDVPARYNLNDVALAKDGTLYVSHMFDKPQDAQGAAALKQAFLTAAPIGHALHWTPAQGWQSVPDTSAAFANGIALSQDGQWLALSGTFDQKIIMKNVATGKVHRISVPLQPDNLSPEGAHGFLVAGHTGVPVTGVDGCRPAEAVPCGFPFAVALVKPNKPAKLLYSDDGQHIAGASVAVRWQRQLLLGSAYGDRLTLVPSN